MLLANQLQLSIAFILSITKHLLKYFVHHCGVVMEMIGDRTI